MNKEYMHISNNEIIVTDENGHLTKRVTDSADIQSELELENHLETVNNLIAELENKVSDYDSRKVSKPEKVLLTASFIFAGIVCLIEPITELSTQIGLLIVAGSTSMVMAISAVASKSNTRMINGAKQQLETAYAIRDNLQKELIETREKTKTENNNLQSENKTNEPITIKENSSYMGELYRQLDEAYVNGYNQKNDKQKRLVLTHSKKNKNNENE